MTDYEFCKSQKNYYFSVVADTNNAVDVDDVNSIMIHMLKTYSFRLLIFDIYYLIELEIMIKKAKKNVFGFWLFCICSSGFLYSDEWATFFSNDLKIFTDFFSHFFFFDSKQS